VTSTRVFDASESGSVIRTDDEAGISDGT